MSYQVIVCPDKQCRGVNIIKDDGAKTALCSRCDKQHPIKKYKVSFKSDSREDAVAARTKLLMKLNNDDMEFEEIREKGYLEEPDKVFSNRSERESRSPKEIVRSNLRDLEEPSRQDIIDSSTKNKKVNKEKAEKAIKSMIREGEVIDYGSHLRIL